MAKAIRPLIRYATTLDRIDVPNDGKLTIQAPRIISHILLRTTATRITLTVDPIQTLLKLLSGHTTLFWSPWRLSSKMIDTDAKLTNKAARTTLGRSSHAPAEVVAVPQIVLDMVNANAKLANIQPI